MAKRKSRRTKRRSTAPRQPGSQLQTEPRTEADLATEYHYVAEDLGRIAIIAAILIAVLVGLSFFL